MTKSKDIRSSTQEMYWRLVTEMTEAYINSGKTPVQFDLRETILKRGLEQRIDNIREKTPELVSEHFLGVSTISNPRLSEKYVSIKVLKNEPTFIYGLHHRGYPSAFRYNLEGWKSEPPSPMSPSQITSNFWGRTQTLGCIASWLIHRHNGEASLIRSPKNRIWDSWNSILGCYSANINTSHLGGGKTLKGIQASMFKALLNERVRGNSEYGYLYFLFTAAFGGLLNMNVDERLKIRSEVLTRAGVDPYPHSQRCFVAPNWGTVKPYWEGRFNPFITLDKIRGSLYTTLSKYGFERSGSKPGEYIWMHPDAPYHENPAYLAESVEFIQNYPTRSDIDKVLGNGRVSCNGFHFDTAIEHKVVVLDYLNERMPEYLEQQFLNQRA
jgi:hypothetical protein